MSAPGTDTSAAAAPPSLEATISALPDLLGRRLAEIEKREQDLAKAEKAFAEETGKAYGSAKPGDVLQLNVGGTKLTVLRSTICYAEGSMLGSKFSGRWDDSLERDKEGNFFIDQPYELFCILINYFRACMSATPKAPPVSIHKMTRDLKPHEKEDFIRMVEYYGCTGAVYPTKIQSSSESAKVREYPEFTVESPDWSTSTVLSDGEHYRRIKSFQVEVGDVERIVVGVSTKRDLGSDFKGLGEEPYTLGIDSCNSSIVLFGGNGKVTKGLEDVKISKGTVIKFDLYQSNSTTDQSSWPEKVFVDGKLAFAWTDVYRLDSSLSKGTDVFPAISVKGSFRLCDVELGFE